MKQYTKLITVMFLWAICFPLITLGIDYSPHLTFASLRAILAGSTLILAAILLKRKFPKKNHEWLVITGIGIGATFLAFFGMFHAAEFVAPGLATVISSTQPLLAAIIAHFFLTERLNRRGLIGLIV